MASLNASNASAGDAAGQQLSPESPAVSLDLPSIDKLLSDSPLSQSESLPARNPIVNQDQEDMFRALKDMIDNFDFEANSNSNVDENGNESSSTKTFDLKALHSSLEKADADDRSGQRNVGPLENVLDILFKLWSANSGLLSRAAEVLANGVRDPSWRVPIGKSGILKFFLDVISSKEQVETNLLLHSLRLIGNSCADTDENREIVVKDNYTLAIIRHFLNPDLIHVAIPVIYNICMDYEPAHSQMAANRAAYIILSLLRDGNIPENDALLSFSYDLIELSSEQEAAGIENSPDGIILLMMELALKEDITFEHYAPLVTSLSAYLEKERFQNACIKNQMVEQALSVLKRSITIEIDTSSKEDVQNLAQLRLKINTALAEVSASPLFAEYYPLNSSLSRTLKSWIIAEEDQLQICACVMLGNLARSDEICTTMVNELRIHEELISVINSEARGAVLHSVLGFLKNLAIASENRRSLAEAGIIPAISRLWAFDSVPQIQFSASTIARQVIISSVENIGRLLGPLSEDPDSPAHQRTYLSMLLSLFEKTDSAPIKTEIGRTVASICRTLCPKAKDGDAEAESLLERLFTLHQGVANPVGSMITQTQWPVVRSEGWFALALMATTPSGCVAVVDCLGNGDVMEMLKSAMTGEIPASKEAEVEGEGETPKPNESQMQKDHDNVLVLIQTLLKNESDILPIGYRETMEDLTKNHATLSSHSS